MACIRDEICTECGKTKPMNIHGLQRVCNECLTAKANAERKAHFEYLDSLPIEARIRKIEEWIYDYKPQHVEPPMYA